jgi:hypothetical protein
LIDNVKRYEGQHGPIEEGEGPDGNIGIIH